MSAGSLDEVTATSCSSREGGEEQERWGAPCHTPPAPHPQVAVPRRGEVQGREAEVAGGVEGQERPEWREAVHQGEARSSLLWWWWWWW